MMDTKKLTLVDRISLRISGIASFLITGFLVWSLYVSFVVVVPIEMLETTLEPAVTGNIVSVKETRKYKVLTNTTLTTRRILVAEGSGFQIPLEGGSLPVEVGEFEIVKQFLLPSTTRGVWCEHFVMLWRPTLSFREHSMEFPTVCFMIKE